MEPWRTERIYKIDPDIPYSASTPSAVVQLVQDFPFAEDEIWIFRIHENNQDLGLAEWVEESRQDERARGISGSICLLVELIMSYSTNDKMPLILHFNHAIGDEYCQNIKPALPAFEKFFDLASALKQITTTSQ